MPGSDEADKRKETGRPQAGDAALARAPRSCGEAGPGERGESGADSGPATPGDAPPPPAGPRAVPKPSAASRDRPVPKPVRPKRSGRPPPAAETPPRGALSDAAEAPGRIGGEAPLFTPRRPPQTRAGAERPAEQRRLTAAGLTRTTRPGITQAVKIGPVEGPSAAAYTTHLHRDQDRVIIREHVDVAYRFVARARPSLGRKVYQGRLVDISLGGAQLEGAAPEGVPNEELLSEEVVLTAEMALPFVEGPLVVDSHIAWIKPAGGEDCFLGLVFIDMTDKHINVIRAFLIGLQSPTRTKFRRGRQ